MRTFSSFAIVLSAALLLAACSSVKLDETNAPIENRAATKTGAGTNASTTAIATDRADTRAVNTLDAGSNPTSDPQGIPAKRSIYFDYDSYSVKEEFHSVVEAHAKYLNTNRNRKAIIQGNTDDRGGTEYNLALGQKRAEAVRKALILLGTSDTQIEAVSFGKEKPKAMGSDEAAWAENRRADIVYQ